MHRKLALVALLVSVALVGLYFFLQEGRSGRGRSPAGPGASVGEDRSRAAPSELVPAAQPVADERPAPAEREDRARPAEAIAVEHQSFALDDAQWLDVTVVFPTGLPLEDWPALVAVASLEDTVDAGDVGEALDLDDGFTAALGEDERWARRPLEARMRVPFPAGSAHGVLFLQSRYLYMDPVQVWLPPDEPVTLEPELGGYVTGRCAFEGGTVPDAGAISVELQGRARDGGLMGFRDTDARDGRVRDDYTFELRALSAQKKYAVVAKAKGFVGYFELSFTVAPGEHRELALAFRPGASIAGFVRGEGTPPMGARVNANARGMVPWSDDLAATTDASGAFLIEGLPTGKVSLAASLDGWREAEQEGIEVVEGGRVEGIELVLDPGGRIGGTVRWPDGAPAAEAEVSAFKTSQRWMQELVEVRSGADGRFVLGGLDEDAVEVFAKRSPRETDGGEHAWTAGAESVSPGTADLVLTLQPPILVHGSVVDDTGAPVAAFQVAAQRAQRPEHAPGSARQSFEAADGAFTLAVGQAGEWAFTARDPEEDERASEEVTLAVPQGAAALRLVLPRASAVAGRAVDPAGNPVEGASIHVSDSAQETAFARFRGDGTKSDADGRFRIEDVTSGGWIHATHDDWAPSEPVALDLAPGTTREDLVLALRLGARITGEVFDAEGEPEAGQNVNCAGGAMAAMAFGFAAERSAVTDGSGRFALEHVTPGKITVSALPSEEELMERLSEGAEEEAFIAMMSDMRTATVEVADGGEAHVVLGAKPKQPVRVHGRVSAAGSALVNHQVFAFAEGGAILAGMKLARTDDAGRYEFVLDRPGDYVFGVGRDEGMEGTGTQFYVEVPETDELEQDLALPLGRITGVVHGPDGPAAGVMLRLVATEGMMGIDDLSESNRAATSGDGAFAFEHLKPATYALHVASVFGGGDGDGRFGQLVVDGLVVEEDRALEGLVIRLAAPGKLAGTVRDAAGDPAAGVAIFVRDSAGRAISATSCTTDGNGRFIYAGITPGRVTASAKSSRLASGESATVEIRSGETSNVDLVVNEGTFLVVALLDDDKPVRARLRVLDEAGRRVDDLYSMEDFMNLLGEGFSSRERRVGPLPPGKYTLIATTLDGKDAKKSVLVEAGQEERSVKLRLK